MMDNVLGLALLGLICCRYHKVWRAEADRKRMKGTDRGQQAERKKKKEVLITAIACWGMTKAGVIRCRKFGEFPRLLQAGSLCS